MAHRTIQCKKCGCIIDLDEYKHNKTFTKKIKATELCFDCIYWDEYIQSPQKGAYIASGKIYAVKTIHAELTKKQLKHGDFLFVMEISTGRAVAFEGYRLVGNIPARFREDLPDQYKIISLETYRRIVSYEGVCCMFKGCYDRYHCLWYDAQKAEPRGAWNKVPKCHVPGGENCESFINKFTMYDMD